MDSDTMRGHDSYQKVFDDFNKGNIDILIGTQMIAKGHHFPNVTLVGVINADLSLYLPDFRAPERTFQLLTQVAGRAGRGEVKGEVIIQTVGPHNPAIVYAADNDFDGFFKEEMEIRTELSYPPAAHLIAVHFRGEDVTKVAAYANEFMEKAKPFLTRDIIVSDPVPASIERIKRNFRYIMMFRGANMKSFRTNLRELVLHTKHSKDVEMYIDVDALSLM
jgi:primosomal protein N' (replication factor Y)